MVTRVSVQNYDNGTVPDYQGGNNNHHHHREDNGGIRAAEAFIDSNMDEADHGDSPAETDRLSDVDRDAVTQDNVEHDEGSNTVDGLDERYKEPVQIPIFGVEDDRSSLESSGSLRNSCSVLTTKDVLPIETARARFLQVVLDNFVREHLLEKRDASADDTSQLDEDKMSKRKSGEVQYEGDPRFALPLMYVANLYETLVNEVNLKMASLNGLREKTIGVALEASGGLYRMLTKKFPKSGSYSFKRRELATSMETRRRFPELVVQDEKRVRFVVANGLSIVEKPTEMPAEDAEWFKRLTGRTEVAVSARNYKFYNPRHKVRRASLSASPTTPGLLLYNGCSDHEFQSSAENAEPVHRDTPSKQHLVTVARQPHYSPVLLNHHQSLNQSQPATLISCSHESGQSSHLHDITRINESPTLSENLASVEPLAGSHVAGNMLPSSPAKFCDECGSPYVRPTSKFCSECGTKRFGI